jgi:hypothetical protein
MKKFILVAPALALLLTAAVSRADTIVFKNGEEIEGAVLEKDDIAIKLKVEYGTLLVPMARVRRIDADTPEQIEERKKRKDEAEEFAAKMKEDGKVLFKGKWVTEAKKKAEEDKIAAANKKKKEDAEEAKKKAQVAAAKAKEAADKAAADLAQTNATNTREDRFSQRHNRTGLSSDVLNQNSNSGYGGSSTILSGNGYRGGR